MVYGRAAYLPLSADHKNKNKNKNKKNKKKPLLIASFQELVPSQRNGKKKRAGWDERHFKVINKEVREEKVKPISFSSSMSSIFMR